MRKTEIMASASFSLLSYGNGWGYSLIYTAGVENEEGDKPSVWFQDDDATAFRERLEAYEKAMPDTPTEEILGELFREYT